MVFQEKCQTFFIKKMFSTAKHSFHSDNWGHFTGQTFQTVFIEVNLLISFMNFFFYIDKWFLEVLNYLRLWKIAFQKFWVILSKQLFNLALGFCLVWIIWKFFNVFEWKLKLGHVEGTSSRRNLPFWFFVSFH